MNITGLGVDLCDVRRFERLWSRHGLRLAQRVLSAAELPKLHAHPQPARMLASVWAVKEACAKACGSGIGAGLSWHDVSLHHHSSGQPYLEWAGHLSVKHSLVSLSHEGDWVVATVAIEKR